MVILRNYLEVKVPMGTAVGVVGGWVVLCIFSAGCLALGWYASKRLKGTADDFLTSRESLSVPVAVASLAATWVWSSTVMGSAEGAYTFGAAGFWMYGAVVPVSTLLLGQHVIPRLRRIMPTAATFPELMRYRFGGAVHSVFTFVAAGQMFFWGVPCDQTCIN